MRFIDVPWPDLRDVACALVPHALRRGLEAGDAKATLRRLQMRWHPDKWMQRYVSRLAKADTERVLTRVKEIAQIVNGLKVG